MMEMGAPPQLGDHNAPPQCFFRMLGYFFWRIMRLDTPFRLLTRLEGRMSNFDCDPVVEHARLEQISGSPTLAAPPARRARCSLPRPHADYGSGRFHRLRSLPARRRACAFRPVAARRLGESPLRAP